MKMKKLALTNINIIYIVITISILGIATLSYINRFGAGITYDSIFYITGGDNIVKGDGYIDIWGKPMVNWPPLYSSFIAFFSLITGSAIQSANYVSIIFFGLNIFLVGIILFRITNNSYWPTILGLIIFSTSFDIYLVHRMAWSEPAFYFFMLLSLFYISKFLEQKSFTPLFLSSIFITLAIMARYVGVLFLFVGSFALIFKLKDSIAKKIKYFLILSLIPLLTLAAWITRNYLLTQSTFQRTIQIHPIKIADLKVLFDTLSNWFFPFGVSNKLELIGSFILAAISVSLLLYFSWQLLVKRNSLKPLPYIFLVFTIFYIATIFLFRLFLHAHDNAAFRFRLVSPVYISGLILVVWLVSVELNKKRTIPLIKYLLLSILLLLLLAHVIRIGRWVKGVDDGYGYASLKWKNSETINYVKSLPDSIKVYTNLPSLFCLYTDKNIESVYVNDYSKINFNKSIIVLIKGIDTRPLKNPESKLDLQKIEKFNDGIIYCSQQFYELVDK